MRQWRKTEAGPRSGSSGVPKAAPTRCQGDEGAALAEFALALPLLVLFIFGIIEFGWLFGQHLDIRHGAREASRLVAVDYNPNDEAAASDQADDIIADVCDRMDLDNGATVELGLTTASLAASTPTEAGNFAYVHVSSDPSQLTGLFSPIINNITLDSTVETRLEQDANWIASPYTAVSGTCAWRGWRP